MPINNQVHDSGSMAVSFRQKCQNNPPLGGEGPDSAQKKVLISLRAIAHMFKNATDSDSILELFMNNILFRQSLCQ